VANSKGLLLDEPLSALDAKVRNKLRREIRETHEKLKITTIMVTHDQEEALTMADRIVVMDKGRIMQIDTPQNIYEFPSNPFVADFIGEINFIKNQNHFKAIRPENININGGQGLAAKINHREFRGSFYRITLFLINEKQLIKVDIPSNKRTDILENNQTVFVDLPAEKIIIYEDNENTFNYINKKTVLSS